MKTFITILGTALLFSACVSQKQYADLEARYSEMQSKLESSRNTLSTCQGDLKAANAKVASLTDQVGDLKNTNNALLENVGNLSTLSTKEAENLERSLESIREKDLQIRTMQDALNKKDSVTLALVTSLKGALGNLSDEDIEVNVEKGVVYISISDKLLFKSGSYFVSDRAKEVLGKVAIVVNDKPDIDFIVEGHTDDVPIKNDVLLDNWDLSVKRATAVVRVLQNDFNVDPKRMTAAGRSYYIPLADNDTAENRAKNRRTRIVVSPKLDEFYSMIEQGMKEATQGGE